VVVRIGTLKCLDGGVEPAAVFAIALSSVSTNAARSDQPKWPPSSRMIRESSSLTEYQIRTRTFADPLA
jgi:hypothetical protein